MSTSDGVDTKALDLQALWRRQLSVELGLHDLIVAHIPALEMKRRPKHMMLHLPYFSHV